VWLALRERLALKQRVARSSSSSGKTRSRDRSEDALAEALSRLISNAPADRALPTTRELGRQLRVANTTVFRLLRDLAAAGKVWQHPVNGRYYPLAARALFDRPKPVACVIRRLELASALYRELLEGISAGCGELRRTMLLWHDELLVNHPDAHEPPVFARAGQQRAILHDFLDRHGGAAGGFILDHVWTDEALSAESKMLQPAVVLFRTCTVPTLGNVRADFRAGAFKALAYLLGRGFEQIVPVVPFEGDPAVDEFETTLERVASELDCKARLADRALVTRASERTALIQRIKRSSRRTALLCPEDNVALLLLNAVREAGLSCPGQVGVASVMGTDLAVNAKLTCLRYDFRRMGKIAVHALASATPVREAIEPDLAAGAST
jgi:hypothetical protein